MASGMDMKISNEFKFVEEVDSISFSRLKKKLAQLLPSHRHYFQSLSVRKYISESDKKTKLELIGKSENKDISILSCTSTFPSLEHEAREFIKRAFLYLVATKLDYKDLATHFYNILKEIYRDVRLQDRDTYTIINYSEVKFDKASSIFSASLREHSIIFLRDDADSKSFKYEGNRVGDVLYVCKNSIDDFNLFHLIGMLTLEPTFSHSSFIYSKALNIKDKKIFSILDELRSSEPSESYLLKKKLVELPESDGVGFELVCAEILKFVFSFGYKELSLITQLPNRTKVRKRDFVIDNRAPTHSFLSSLSKAGVKYILFDAKNYGTALSTADLDTFFSYIQEQKYFGKFGIILSRKGAKKNAHDHMYTRMLRNNDEVLILDQDDLLRLIDLGATGRDPISYISEKHRNFQLQA